MHERFDGFLLAYFGNGAQPDAEQVRIAVTPRRDPGTWLPLNGGRPVVRSDVGEHGVRDPFILRDGSRGRFVLLATDLRTYPDADWARAVRHGSRSIVVWDSTDLVHWSRPRLAAVAPAEAGNAWAPKAFWSGERNAWLVFFASAVYEGPDRREERHQRILVAETRDFSRFSPASTYLDPGHDVIDATFLQWHDEFSRFTADSLTNRPGEEWRFVSQERGTALTSTDWAPVARDLGAGSQRHAEGPAPFAALDGGGAYLLLDEFELRGYQLYSSRSPHDAEWEHVASARLPEGARHGSVIPITAAERERLIAAYPETDL
ncbi:glycoside hydrolase family 43 protein [Sinomonas sp. G460-2]|uniref:glycoside hydrolase family 43 protein n=1 Tax=Sinomonas sp. G460-2 TaxID=3393464 RepID=UPI0039EFADDF